MEGSSVLFAPRSFADPLRYESTAESQSNVTDYKNLFNSLFAATSADEVTKILTNHKATAGLCVTCWLCLHTSLLSAYDVCIA